MNLQQGFIQVYTGNGKGKTTAAIGLAVRALGHGFKVYFAQFMKDFPYGELNILRQFSPQIEIRNWGNDRFVFQKQTPSLELIAEMSKGLNEALNAMLSEQFDLLILDEVLVSIYFKLFKVEQIVNFLRQKPKTVEVILTGRYCPQEIIKMADLVTEMQEVKHYYQSGIMARKGIEN